jgi:hypothetical protein
MSTEKQYNYFKNQIAKYESNNNIKTESKSISCQTDPIEIQTDQVQENVLMLSMNDMMHTYNKLEADHTKLKRDQNIIINTSLQLQKAIFKDKLAKIKISMSRPEIIDKIILIRNSM